MKNAIQFSGARTISTSTDDPFAQKQTTSPKSCQIHISKQHPEQTRVLTLPIKHVLMRGAIKTICACYLNRSAAKMRNSLYTVTACIVYC